jgi:hypothetical protein
VLLQHTPHQYAGAVNSSLIPGYGRLFATALRPRLGAWLQFSCRARWHYDVLRPLEYFRAAADPPDPRVDEPIDLLRSKQQPDGTWLLENTHPGAVHFALEDGDGRPSRWNTLRALRVLRWYEQ